MENYSLFETKKLQKILLTDTYFRTLRKTLKYLLKYFSYSQNYVYVWENLAKFKKNKTKIVFLKIIPIFVFGMWPSNPLWKVKKKGLNYILLYSELIKSFSIKSAYAFVDN